MQVARYANLITTSHVITATPGCYGSGVASAITGAVDHGGPVLLWYGLETIASATAGATRLIFAWVTPDGVSCTASGGGCNVAANSATAQGQIPMNVGAGRSFYWYLSAATAVALDRITANRPRQRFWISFFGADDVYVSASAAGMIQD